jgi:hypothetical protein
MSLVPDISTVRGEGKFSVEIQVAIGLNLDAPNDDLSETGVLDFRDVVRRIDIQRATTKDASESSLSRRRIRERDYEKGKQGCDIADGSCAAKMADGRNAE